MEAAAKTAAKAVTYSCGGEFLQLSATLAIPKQRREVTLTSYPYLLSNDLQVPVSAQLRKLVVCIL